MIHNHDSIDVFIGVDVGKSNHHAVALKGRQEAPRQRLAPVRSQA